MESFGTGSARAWIDAGLLPDARRASCSEQEKLTDYHMQPGLLQY
jgi:hypothetical protein